MKHRRVDFHRNQVDFAVVYYAGLGLSLECIEELTNLSHAQVRYRLRLAKVSPKGYRSGRTPISKFVTQRCRAIAEKIILKQLP